MVIKALFTADGLDEVEVIAMSYSLDQNIDSIGQPAGEVRGGQITITLGTNGTEARYGWMVASDMKKSGEINMVDATGQTLKTIKFEDAYCIGFTEKYDAFTGGQAGGVNVKEGAREMLTLSCRSIDVAGEIHENSWNF